MTLRVGKLICLQEFTLKVEILDRKLRKAVDNSAKLTKQYGYENAKKIIQRLGELEDAPNFGFMMKFKIGRCHALTGNLKGKYALDLHHPQRMIIEPVYSDNSERIEQVEIVNVLKTGDYHG